MSTAVQEKRVVDGLIAALRGLRIWQDPDCWCTGATVYKGTQHDPECIAARKACDAAQRRRK